LSDPCFCFTASKNCTLTESKKNVDQDPATKKRKGTKDPLELIALARTLPPEAQKDDYDGSKKSYTLKDPKENARASISVLVEKQTFYVCPVEELPGWAKDRYKINKQDCFFNVFWRWAGVNCLTKGGHASYVVGRVA
jgi:hypothetical protein